MAKLFAQIEPESRSIVYVDFLGLIRVPGLDAAQQYAVTTEVGLALKRAAIELKIPIVAGVQLNRQAEMRKEKHPILADFRDSGRLEEIADLALGLHRPGFYDRQLIDNELQVFCLKNATVRGRTMCSAGMQKPRAAGKTTKHPGWKESHDFYRSILSRESRQA